MNTKGRGFLLAASVMTSILAGAAPALAESHGGGHASGAGHSGGGARASAGGHVGGGAHYAAAGHYGGASYAHSYPAGFHGSYGHAGGYYGRPGGYYGHGYSTGAYWRGGYLHRGVCARAD